MSPSPAILNSGPDETVQLPPGQVLAIPHQAPEVSVDRTTALDPRVVAMLLNLDRRKAELLPVHERPGGSDFNLNELSRQVNGQPADEEPYEGLSARSFNRGKRLDGFMAFAAGVGLVAMTAVSLLGIKHKTEIINVLPGGRPATTAEANPGSSTSIITLPSETSTTPTVTVRLPGSTSTTASTLKPSTTQAAPTLSSSPESVSSSSTSTSTTEASTTSSSSTSTTRTTSTTAPSSTTSSTARPSSTVPAPSTTSTTRPSSTTASTANSSTSTTRLSSTTTTPASSTTATTARPVLSVTLPPPPTT